MRAAHELDLLRHLLHAGGAWGRVVEASRGSEVPVRRRGIRRLLQVRMARGEGPCIPPCHHRRNLRGLLLRGWARTLSSFTDCGARRGESQRKGKGPDWRT
jgi:hypothetical protein